MQITLQLDPNEFSDQNKILIQLLSKKHKLAIIYFVGAFIFFLSYGLIRYNTYSIYYFALSVACIFIAITFIRQLLATKKVFTLYTINRMSHLKLSGTMTLEINTVSIKYADIGISSEIKWQAYSHYLFYKKYLLLYIYGDFSPQTLIPLEKLTEEQKRDLTAFISSRLYKKN
jgi:hypothetical protein